MSETPLQQAIKKAADEKARGVKPMPASDAFGGSSDVMTRVNIYIPTETIEALKQRALDESKGAEPNKKASVSKLIVEAVTSSWSLNEPVRRAQPKQKWDKPDYDLS